MNIGMPDVLARLQQTFGARLLYLGLQGSSRRGEVAETSEIDLVVLPDSVGLDGLGVYRSIVHAMPEGNKACGFICGVEELALWSPHKLFGFARDTADNWGRLEDWLPPVTRADVRFEVGVNVSTLLHMLTPSYMYAEEKKARVILKEAHKAAFFLMLVVQHLDSGHYCGSRRKLLSRLGGTEREIIMAGLNFTGWLKEHSEREAFGMFLDWERRVLRNR
jgi:hypothetical protein